MVPLVVTFMRVIRLTAAQGGSGWLAAGDGHHGGGRGGSDGRVDLPMHRPRGWSAPALVLTIRRDVRIDVHDTRSDRLDGDQQGLESGGLAG